ncbi:MAG: DEAD/DEAH box helicase, partial [Rhodobacterales bacterium]|nr:DEAD/DEAH box helicase [Rhodobacterales bacterium]
DWTATTVLDEADQMLDLGFVPAIRKIMARLPKERQTVLMSATMPSQIRKLAAEFQTNAQEISVATVSRPIERIAQSVQYVAAEEKRVALSRILTEADDARAIVFTRTKRGADKLCRHLDSEGFTAAAIHGNKSQPQRERALSGFRAGRTTIL